MTEKQVTIVALATLLTLDQQLDYSSPETLDEQIRDSITELELALGEM